MANSNPDTSGLISLADRPNNERATIQHMGGVASGKKRREIKRVADIVQNIRKESEIDPIVAFVKLLFSKLTDGEFKIKDAIQLLSFIKQIEPEITPEPHRSSIAEIIAFRKYIQATCSPTMPKDEKERRKKELEKYMDV